MYRDATTARNGKLKSAAVKVFDNGSRFQRPYRLLSISFQLLSRIGLAFIREAVNSNCLVMKPFVLCGVQIRQLITAFRFFAVVLKITAKLRCAFLIKQAKKAACICF